MRAPLVVLALALALLVAPAHAQSHGPCSDSHVQLVGYNNLFPVSTAGFDSTYSVPGFGPRSWTRFNLNDGTLAMWQAVGGANWTRVIATDDYDVVGVSPGTVVPITVELDVHGDLSSPGCGGSGCGGYLQASITQRANSTQQQVTFPDPFAGGQVNMAQTLTLPITITAGTPATIDFELATFVPAGGNAGGEGTGIVNFVLPEGVHIASCKGYWVFINPVHTSSWGRLKSHYR